MSRKQFSIYDLPDTIYQLADLVDDLDSRFSQMQQSMNNQFTSQATAITNKFAAQETQIATGFTNQQSNINSKFTAQEAYMNGKFVSVGDQIATVNNNVISGPVKSVQRGVFTPSGNGDHTVTISAVNMQKSVLVASTLYGAGSPSYQIHAYLSSVASIIFHSFAMAVPISWQVIEFK